MGRSIEFVLPDAQSIFGRGCNLSATNALAGVGGIAFAFGATFGVPVQPNRRFDVASRGNDALHKHWMVLGCPSLYRDQYNDIQFK